MPSRGVELLRLAGEHPIVRSFPHGALIVFDHDLRFLAAGGLGLAAVGLSRERLEGHTIEEVFPPEVVEVIEPLYRAALRGEESTMDVPYEGRIYLQRLGPLYDEDMKVLAGMGFTQDVTETRQAQEALETSQERLREEHRRLDEAQSVGRVGSWEWDLGTGLMTLSDAILSLYGMDRSQLGRDYESVLARIHPDDRATVDAAVQDCLKTGSTFAVRYRVIRLDDGELRWFDAKGRTLYDGDVAMRLAGAVADVTEQVEAEQEALEAQAFQQAVLAATPDLTLVIDLPSGRVAYGSRAEGMLGRTTTELTALESDGRLLLIHPDDRDHVAATNIAAEKLSDGEVLQLRYRGLHPDGSWSWRSRRITPFRRNDEGTVVQVVGVTRDVTEVVEAEDRLRDAALHDPLTHLPNRALLIDRIDTALARAEREGREVAVMFCDLDGFKRVNDTFGHSAGDAVLVEVARRISAVIRPQDTVARVGGDEFVVVLEPWDRASADGTAPPDMDHEELDRDLAQRLAARVMAELRRPVLVDGVEHVVTASIGITYSTGASGSVTADQIVQDADAAMYRAKSLGKNRAEVF